MIKVNSLNKYYNKGRQNEIHVLNDISLDLPERGIVAVFGASGCGKTTLLNVLGGLDGYGGGEVKIDGKDIRNKTDDVRNRYIGYIFQNYNLNAGESCYDNVADALRLCGITDKKITDERVYAALKNVGMDKFAYRTPDTLSGGQQQRVAIARAIVKNPKVILADEPTGNLDEANTVIIMDLLRQIANEHLVVLVTHEQNLVDHYCDTVIELSDGAIVKTYDNTITGGYAVRDKNAVYLGELEHSRTSDDLVDVEYYGAKPASPIKLKIVNSGGKTYLQIDTAGVNVLDSGSEVRLREGVYRQDAATEHAKSNIDMSALPSVEANKCGRLFTLRQAIKSGYTENFKKGKKGRTFFRVCMMLFAVVFVFVTASFGTSFYTMSQISNKCNDNTFYVLVSSDEIGQKLNEACNKREQGIDYARVKGQMSLDWDSNPAIYFDTDYFETFNIGGGLFGAGNGLEVSSLYYSESLCENLPLVAGKKDKLRANEMVITSAVADMLLKGSKVGFISEYADLIDLKTDTDNGVAPRTVAGIVKSKEIALYLPAREMETLSVNSTLRNVYRGSDYNADVADGEVLSNYKPLGGEEMPKAGTEIYIHGKPLNIRYTSLGQYEYYSAYSDYCEKASKKPTDVQTYIYDKIRQDHPDGALFDYVDEYYNLYGYEAVENYLEYADDYFENNLSASEADGEEAYICWLARYKKSPEARARALRNELPKLLGNQTLVASEYYWAQKYYEEVGQYPAREQFMQQFGSVGVADAAYYKDLEECLKSYEAEYGEYLNTHVSIPNGFFLSDADYSEISRRLGKTFNACGGFTDRYCGYSYVEGKEKLNEVQSARLYQCYYMLIHTVSPKSTQSYLQKTFASYDTGNKEVPLIITPKLLRSEFMTDSRIEILVGFIALAVILALLCLCMYFIMRSSFMTRIKQVGIYRAIGASKRNIIFKFLIETLVLTLLTVFIGYLAASVFIGSLGSTAIMASVLYYPAWLAVCAFAVLTGVSLLFGVLPVLNLLRKTPSEILAKYDI